MVQGPAGKYISETNFARLTMDGCAYCTANITVADDKFIVWTHDNRPICGPCANELTECGVMASGVIQ